MQTEKCRSVLIVDDEALIAIDMADMVERLGTGVIGPAFDLKEAFDLLEDNNPDAALLDIDVGGDVVWPLASALVSRGCKIAFVSANAHHKELDEIFPAAPVIDKPINASDVASVLGQLAN